jgi:hypothetical protein
MLTEIKQRTHAVHHVRTVLRLLSGYINASNDAEASTLMLKLLLACNTGILVMLIRLEHTHSRFSDSRSLRLAFYSHAHGIRSSLTYHVQHWHTAASSPRSGLAVKNSKSSRMWRNISRWS